MTKYISTLLGALLAGLSVTSCSDWFDVSPKTDVKADLLFEGETGFQSALTGLYVSMTESALYGGAYTFNFMDKLAQRYDSYPTRDPSNEDKAVIYNYGEHNTTYDSKTTLAAMWLNSYKVIANANNLLRWLDLNGERVLSDETVRNHIRGEALAVRAMLHFDLLRGWGPIYRQDSTAKSIPYRVVLDGSRQPRLPANEIVSKIIKDLFAAERLLLDEEESPLDNSDRRYRLNLHAVRGLLARVLNYRGDRERAVRYARAVIDHCGLDFATSGSYREDPALYCETLFGLSYYDMTDRLSGLWSEGPNFNNGQQLFVTQQTLYSIFQTNEGYSADLRGRRGESNAFLYYDDRMQGISRKYLAGQNLVPLIRLPEMYYILCESSPLAEGHQWINEVRTHREISSTSNYAPFGDEQARTDALDLEYRKEFYAEGQYFPFLKQHARTTFLNCPIAAMTAAEYIFPLPDDEVEYGWVDDEETLEGAE